MQTLYVQKEAWDAQAVLKIITETRQEVKLMCAGIAGADDSAAAAALLPAVPASRLLLQPGGQDPWTLGHTQFHAAELQVRLQLTGHQTLAQLDRPSFCLPPLLRSSAEASERVVTANSMDISFVL